VRVRRCVPVRNTYYDQSIYGWRLADVRRVLGLAGALPGLRRVDLEVNYRCPAPVIAAAVRLVRHNAERFAQRGPDACLDVDPGEPDARMRVSRAGVTQLAECLLPKQVDGPEG
jgi:superfamily I DNA/RNA helicase